MVSDVSTIEGGEYELLTINAIGKNYNRQQLITTKTRETNTNGDGKFDQSVVYAVGRQIERLGSWDKIRKMIRKMLNNVTLKIERGNLTRFQRVNRSVINDLKDMM